MKHKTFVFYQTELCEMRTFNTGYRGWERQLFVTGSCVSLDCNKRRELGKFRSESKAGCKWLEQLRTNTALWQCLSSKGQ